MNIFSGITTNEQSNLSNFWFRIRISTIHFHSKYKFWLICIFNHSNCKGSATAQPKFIELNVINIRTSTLWSVWVTKVWRTCEIRIFSLKTWVNNWKMIPGTYFDEMKLWLNRVYLRSKRLIRWKSRQISVNSAANFHARINKVLSFVELFLSCVKHNIFPLKWKFVQRELWWRGKADDVYGEIFTLYVGCFTSSSWWLLPVLTTPTIYREKIIGKKGAPKFSFVSVSVFSVSQIIWRYSLSHRIKSIVNHIFVFLNIRVTR